MLRKIKLKNNAFVVLQKLRDQCNLFILLPVAFVLSCSLPAVAQEKVESNVDQEDIERFIAKTRANIEDIDNSIKIASDAFDRDIEELRRLNR